MDVGLCLTPQPLGGSRTGESRARPAVIVRSPTPGSKTHDQLKPAWSTFCLTRAPTLHDCSFISRISMERTAGRTDGLTRQRAAGRQSRECSCSCEDRLPAPQPASSRSRCRLACSAAVIVAQRSSTADAGMVAFPLESQLAVDSAFAAGATKQ
eukprot:3834815-Alexandrium_andersonii.AAC.1